MKRDFAPIRRWCGYIMGLVMFLYLLAASAGAMVISLEGFAELRVLLATKDQLICTTRTSGGTDWELFALNIRDQKLAWRKTSTNYFTSAFPGELGVIYLLSDGGLEKRRLANGGVIWKTALGLSVAEAKTRPAGSKPMPSLQELAERAAVAVGLRPAPSPATSLSMGTPNRFFLQALPTVGPRLAVFRSAVNHSGCVISHCFDDWMAVDAVTGRVTDGGPGRLAGMAGQTAFVEDSDGLYFATADRSGALPAVQIGGERVQARYGGFGGLEFSRFGGMTVWECENRKSKAQRLALAEDGSRHVRLLEVAPTESFQTAWVLGKDSLLRFAQCPRYGTPVSEAGLPWVELFDFDGRSRGRGSLPVPQPEKGWHSQFLGWTLAGKAVFASGDQLFAVSVPSLHVSNVPIPEPKKYPSSAMAHRVSQVLPDSDLVLLSDGNVSYPKLPAAELSHEFVLTIVSVETGRTVWRHTLPATIRREKR